METQINELYPIMPEWERTAPPSAPPLDGGQSYRLQKINEIQRVLEDEREKRHNLSKKYHKAVKVVGNIDSALVTISMQCFMQRPVHPSYGRVKRNLDGCLFLCGRVWTGQKKKKKSLILMYHGLQYVGLLRVLYRALYTSCYCHII